MATKKQASRKTGSRAPSGWSKERLDRRRNNRILAQYLMLQCWLHQVNRIGLQRKELLEFFNCKTVHHRRSGGYGTFCDELIADFEPWFPEQFPFFKSLYSDWIATIFFCRRPPLKDDWWMHEDGVDIAVIADILPGGKIPPVDDMLAELALISAGVDEPVIKKQRRPPREPRSMQSYAQQR